MKLLILASLLAAGSGQYLTREQYQADNNYVDCFDPTDDDNLYNYQISNLNQTGQINFADYLGKVILLVNVATYCRSTREYPQLNQLQSQFGDQLVVVAFPCTQFKNVSDKYIFTTLSLSFLLCY